MRTWKAEGSTGPKAWGEPRPTSPRLWQPTLPVFACVQTPNGTDGSKKSRTAQPTQLRACLENIATLVVVSIQTLGQANGEIRERLLVGKGPSFGGSENMLITDAVEPPRLISVESSALWLLKRCHLLTSLAFTLGVATSMLAQSLGCD